MGTRTPRSEIVDALRGIAALGVVLYHARGLLYVGGARTLGSGLDLSLRTVEAIVTLPFRFGFLGVPLFFVLSGYCIHLRNAAALKDDPARRLDLGAFAAKRLWRIYPVYLIALGFSALVDAWLAQRGIRVPPAESQTPGALLASLLTLQGYVAPQYTTNAVFWTLAMEVHLYALYPLLYRISRRFGPRTVLGVTGFASLAYILATTQLDLEGWFPHRSVRGPVFLPYWFTWAFGFYIAEAQVGRARPLPRARTLMIAGGALGLATYGAGFVYLAELGWAFACAGLLWVCLRRPRESRHPRTFAALVGAGRISYSLYAMHVPALFLLAAVIAPQGQRFEHVWPLFLGCVVSVVVAWASYHLVERWCIGRPPFTRPVLLAPAVPGERDDA